jgi:hypothetical protein
MLFLFVLENMSYFTPLRIEQVKGGCSVERERPATVLCRFCGGTGPMALCITKNGLEAVNVEDEVAAAPAEAPKDLSQANFRCSKEVRPEEASSGQVDDQNWLVTRRPGGLENKLECSRCWADRRE